MLHTNGRRFTQVLSKQALIQTVMSNEWNAEMSYLTTEQKGKANEVKAIITDTANWRKVESLLTFLEPIVNITTLMSTDIGETLSLFYIGMNCITKAWKTQPYRDKAKGYGGVSFQFARKANDEMWDSWTKHTHPLDATTALLNPYNHVALVEPEPAYLGMKVGTVPISTILDDAKDYFDEFCDKYVRDEASRSRLKAQLQYLIEKNPAHFRSDAFSPTVVREYKNKSAEWWKVYAKGTMKDLMLLATKRTQICRASSSAAERNYSIWGLVHTKLRNRLSLEKACMLIYIYQNIKAVRRARGEPKWCPDLRLDEKTGVLEPTYADDEVAEFWKEFCASNAEAVAQELLTTPAAAAPMALEDPPATRPTAMRRAAPPMTDERQQPANRPFQNDGGA